MPPKQQNSQVLTTQKELSLFKTIIKQYEEKQYRRGLRAAEQILQKYPEHGETLAMKGLILNCMDRKTEAYELVRRGLKNNVKSHICWHVYGLLHRSDRNYMEAIKSYQNALKQDSTNAQILRDLSFLQIQMRDLKGFLDTRKQLLTLKPTNKTNWIAYAVAAHLAGDHTLALKILNNYEDVDKPKTAEEQLDHKILQSELLLYKNLVIEESGDIEGALKHLGEIQNSVMDKLALKLKKAQLLTQLERKEEAEKAWKELLLINSENHEYHKGYQKLLGLSLTPSEEDSERALKIYEELAKLLPNSQAVKFFPLHFSEGSKFETRLDAYVRPALRKGIPSLFTSLKALYNNKSKVEIIEKLFLSYYTSLKSNTFPNSDEVESPIPLLWTFYFLAHHYDYLKNFDKALGYLEEAIAHTPTAVDLYLLKGRIYKHAGDLKQAAALFDYARTLDLADRYLNTKSTLYFLRADQIEQADKTIALFTKDGDTSSQTNLFDMQCMWYEQECGDSNLRQHQYGKALKMYHTIDKHFADITEDQFDFHTYCLRKMTLRSYVKLLRLEDNLYAHKNYVKAALQAINCYIQLHDAPNVKSKIEDELAKLPEAERKKEERKLKKQRAREKRAEEQEKAKKEKEKQNNSNQAKRKGKQDDDPEGEALAKTSNPLGDAKKFLDHLLVYSKKNLDVHLVAFEVYLRRNKNLLMLQAVKRAVNLSPQDPRVHLNIIRCFHKANNTTLSAKVKEIFNLEGQLPEFLGGKTLEQTNSDYLKAHGHKGLEYRLAVAEALYLINPAAKQEAIKILGDITVGDVSVKTLIKAHKLLLDTFKDPEAAQKLKQDANKLFPLATYFQDSLNLSNVAAALPSETKSEDQN